MAGEAEILEITGAPVGFSGPVGLPETVTIIADHDVAAMADFVVGANKPDAHLVGVDVDKDFKVGQFADIREAMEGDDCPSCDDGLLEIKRGIELAHVFKLGKKYATDLNCSYVDEDGKEQIATMGCYGVGVSRILAALVEEHHDDDGIRWPMAVAPYDAAILLLDNEPELIEITDKLSADLEAAGLETVIDDRDERPGVKFKDADLIGYPIRIVIGKRTAKNGTVEIRRRKDAEEMVVPTSEAVEAVRKLAEEA